MRRADAALEEAGTTTTTRLRESIRLRRDRPPHPAPDRQQRREDDEQQHQHSNSNKPLNARCRASCCLKRPCQSVRWITRNTLSKAFALLLLFFIFLGCCTPIKILQIFGLRPLYNKMIAYCLYYAGEEDSLRYHALYDYMGLDERKNVKLHKRSVHRPVPVISLGNERQASAVKNAIGEELQKIPVVSLVSWGVFSMLRPTFPPEINLININGNVSHDGEPTANDWLASNQVLSAHRVPRPVLSNYSITHWEELMAKSNATNVGLILIGDELNYGSSFLNDRLDGTRCPFSFLIRDYYFDKLKNAEQTSVVQLGTMTCNRRELACVVAPPDIVFAKMLAPGVSMQMQPPAIVQASKRSQKCYWAGSNRNERRAMVEHFEESGGCKVYLTPGFNQGLNKTSYADILANTVFGLVPRGNSFETHRLAEILMFGGIPVMLDEDTNAPHMLSYAEPIPLIHGATWKEAEQRMLELSRNDMDEMQQQVLRWWDNHWKCVHDDMRWIMAQAHAISEGRNLCNDI